MTQQDASNINFQLASSLVSDTAQHIFLTGKAGTGKTTFLKYVKEQTSKNTVIVAPTGVAAINAGGVTMHSFFQLPRGIFIPGIVAKQGYSGFSEITDRHTLFKNIHFNSNKRQLLEELELLIIDEVSMMRCDMLDAIDIILRHFRKAPHLPFGGVQVVYIGDLYQLPPVVSHEEWVVLNQYYATPFFFSAKVYTEVATVCIELQKIYRQTEKNFIEILNRIRNNELLPNDLNFLNLRYDPLFQAPKRDQFITITTHNKKADTLNAEELSRLQGSTYTFNAIVKDDFSDRAYPTDVELKLKVGAQVMFIKNDSSNERRFFNGKIAVVKKITGEEITIAFADGTDLMLERETWKHLRYSYHKEHDKIEEEELGSFTQFPVRLAWAITVHKSQGLTFDKAIIDAGASFAPGQVYVALSRCTSLEGMVLKSQIFPTAVSTDQRIVEFSKSQLRDAGHLKEILEHEKYRHWGISLLRLFDFHKLLKSLLHWSQLIAEKKLPDHSTTTLLAHTVLNRANNLSVIAKKFQIQLEKLLSEVSHMNDTGLLQQRMQKAIDYFAGELVHGIMVPIQEHMESIHCTSRLKLYKVALHETEGLTWSMVQKLLCATYGALHFKATPTTYQQYQPLSKKIMDKERVPKGISRKITKELFVTGKNIEEIALRRNMAISTIEGHLSSMVLSGDLMAADLIPLDKLITISEMIEEVGSSAGLIKNRLGDAYSFYDIRVALNHYKIANKNPV